METCIRFIINEYLPEQKGYEYKSNVDYLMNQSDTRTLNFDPISAGDKPDEVLLKLISSIKNLRKNIPSEIGSTKLLDQANLIKRLSYLADLECK